MSPLFRDAAGHDRARELAALRVDEPLEPADAAWLDAHLTACDDCAAVAGAYDEDRLLFAALREAQPVPPRDLWARTAAAIDAESPASRPARRLFGLPVVTRAPAAAVATVSLVPIAAVTAVAVLVGSGFLNGSPVVPLTAGSPEPTAIAITTSDVAVLTRNADGGLEFRVAGVDEVCPLMAEGCAAQPSFEIEQLAEIQTGDSVDAIISPSRDALVVVGRDATGTDGVYVVPVLAALPPGTPGTATPPPTTEPTPPATAEPTAVPTDTTTPAPSPESPEPATAAPTDSPSEGPSEAPTESPATTSPEPTAVPTPEPTAVATPEPTPEPTATVAVTPATDGALRIASDVVVVGSVAAYDEDGTRFAFTARPADGSRGPDVYVWNTSDTRARAVTEDHRSIFAGWDGRDLLVSRVVDGRPHTLAVSPRGVEKAEHGNDAWMPTVSPDGGRAAWWDGTVRLADDGVTWVPDEGRLVLGAWPGDPEKAQVLARDVEGWQAAWDPDGTAIAVWTGRGERAGRLTVYAVDPETGRARLSDPLLDGEAAFPGFAVERGRVVFRAPGTDGGKPAVWMVGWDGKDVGRVQLPGGTVIR